MASLDYSALFKFTVPGPVLAHVQEVYAEDVCEATVELLQRCLEVNLQTIPRLVPWATNQFIISCAPYPAGDGSFSLLISIGAPGYSEGDEDIADAVKEARDHWVRSANNLKLGGAYHTISHLRSPGEPRLQEELLQQVYIQRVSNCWK